MDFSPPEEVFTVIQNSEKSVFTEVKDERGGFGKFVFTKKQICWPRGFQSKNPSQHLISFKCSNQDFKKVAIKSEMLNKIFKELRPPSGIHMIHISHDTLEIGWQGLEGVRF